MVSRSAAPLLFPRLYNGKDKTFFFFNFEQYRETQYRRIYGYGSDGTRIAMEISAEQFLRTVTGLWTTFNGWTTGFCGEIFHPVTGIPYANNMIPLSEQDPVAMTVSEYDSAAYQRQHASTTIRSPNPARGTLRFRRSRLTS